MGSKVAKSTCENPNVSMKVLKKDSYFDLIFVVLKRHNFSPSISPYY